MSEILKDFQKEEEREFNVEEFRDDNPLFNCFTDNYLIT